MLTKFILFAERIYLYWLKSSQAQKNLRISFCPQKELDDIRTIFFRDERFDLIHIIKNLGTEESPSIARRNLIIIATSAVDLSECLLSALNPSGRKAPRRRSSGTFWNTNVNYVFLNHIIWGVGAISSTCV